MRNCRIISDVKFPRVFRYKLECRLPSKKISLDDEVTNEMMNKNSMNVDDIEGLDEKI